MPFVMVLIGCSLTKLYLPKQPQPVSLVPDAYPAPQRILMNLDNVEQTSDNISPQILFDNLPSSMFEVEFLQTDNFTEFYDETFNKRAWGADWPWKYGAY